MALFRDRLASVEALRSKARSSNVIRISLFVVLALAALPVLIGGVFGSVWFAGNYVAQSVALVAVVFVVSTALICWGFFRLAKAVARIREDAVPLYEDAFHEQAVSAGVARGPARLHGDHGSDRRPDRLPRIEAVPGRREHI